MRKIPKKDLTNAPVRDISLDMRAELSQIPGNPGKINVSEPRSQQGYDTICAQIRRIKARLSEVELNLSTNRRDINRIDRKVYREAELQPSFPDKRPADVGLPAGLFQ